MWKYNEKKGKVMTRRFQRFFEYLLKYTLVQRKDMVEIMHGANVEVDDGGCFYNLMCHDILTCERKRKNDEDCEMCKNIHNVYYEEAFYGNGSSHRSWRDKDFPQYRLGKEGRKSRLPNFVGKGVSDNFDFIIGLRDVDGRICSWFQFEAAMGQDNLDSPEDVKQLDNESRLKRTWKMATPGHIWSTLKYGITRRNQGPFGSSNRNDNDPVRLEFLEIETKKHAYFKPIEEEDSVNYTGATLCHHNQKVKFKF